MPPGCETAGRCALGADFGFIDSAKVGWQAAKGRPTDRASIPSWAKPFVGQSFEPAFVRAAVINDHYCDRHVRPWRQTHKVFHEALLKSGVSPAQAGIMYYAVLIGGPKWAKLVKGKPCVVGRACTNQVDVASVARGSSLTLTAEAGLAIKRPADFQSAQFQQRLPRLLAAGGRLTTAEVEAVAAAEMADDFYVRNDDEIGTGLDVRIELQQSRPSRRR